MFNDPVFTAFNDTKSIQIIGLKFLFVSCKPRPHNYEENACGLIVKTIKNQP